ncbi:MAG: ankyrin repeat domain-containing protein [Actinomycetota bacterium]|nr:ankyrin repeat domain-containing protein [Actinomycetota bacterium]
MPTLPAHPNVDQLRHQAKDLLRAANSGDGQALAQIQLVSDQVTLASAQLAIARAYGFASWPKLKAEAEARTLDLAERADAFCKASIGDGSGRAARMLAATPAIAGHSLATAVILGDGGRVSEELRRDPGLATRRDPRSGWTALHAVCASRWHQFEPARSDGLLAVAQLLIEAGADPAAKTGWRRNSWTPLGCAVASANSGPSNQAVVELLLEHGATPDDRDLYLAGFAHDRHQLLPLLLARVPNLREIAEMALAAPISNDDVEGVRSLLRAGADPGRYLDDDGQAIPVLYTAIHSGCSAELLELLLENRADANAAGPDGRSPDRLATAAGRPDLVELLRRYGTDDQATDGDRFLSACLQADRTSAERQLSDGPGLLAALSDDERAAIVRAAEKGKSAAVALMLDLGFPLETRAGDFGSTALHAAAYSGSTDVVRLLLERGSDIEARDSNWNSTPLDWAAVGSGEQPGNDPAADWVETVRTLLAAGASTDDITLSPDDPKQPSPEVAELLRTHGVGL